MHGWRLLEKNVQTKKKDIKKGVDYEKDAFGIKESYKKKDIGPWMYIFGIFF